MPERSGWPDAIHGALGELGVRQVAYVPDAGHARLIGLCSADPAMRAVVLTTEEEGVALLAGAWLGGERGVLLMQSSGVGNCVNFFSLVKHGRFPFLTLVSMRGDYGEANPWQLAMGQSTQPVLEAAGIICLKAESADEVLTTVRAGCTMAYQSEAAVAVLLTQKLLGAKAFSTE